MTVFDSSDYIVGGYFLTHAVPRPDYLDADLIPERIVSVSESITTILQAYWGTAMEHNRDKVVNFGIPAEKHYEFINWSRSNEDVGHPNTFFSLDAARFFVQRFIPNTDKLLLLGAALHKELVADFLEQSKQVVFDPIREIYVHSDYATPKVLKRREHPPTGGETLGYELLGYDAGFWSWLRNGLEKDAYLHYGVRPNQHGLIDEYEQALHVHKWIKSEQQNGSMKVEPIPYAPWMLIRYSPTMTGKTDKLIDRSEPNKPDDEDKADDPETSKTPRHVPRNILQ